jgi:GABA(A) receptor-associated protein
MLSFKNEFSFENRLEEALRVLAKYPNRVPVICERSLQSKQGCPIIDKRKYLVPIDLTMGQFLYVIRRRLKLTHDKALFLFVENTIPSSTHLIGDVYETYKNSDRYLYITYSEENVFG